MLADTGDGIEVEHVGQKLLAVGGLQVVVGHPGLDSAEAERILVAHASAVGGADVEKARV